MEHILLTVANLPGFARSVPLQKLPKLDLTTDAEYSMLLIKYQRATVKFITWLCAIPA